MALSKRFTKTLPFSATQRQYDVIEEDADSRAISMAQVLRELVNDHYELTEEPA